MSLLETRRNILNVQVPIAYSHNQAPTGCNRPHQPGSTPANVPDGPDGARPAETWGSRGEDWKLRPSRRASASSRSFSSAAFSLMAAILSAFFGLAAASAKQRTQATLSEDNTGTSSSGQVPKPPLTQYLTTVKRLVIKVTKPRLNSISGQLRKSPNYYSLYVQPLLISHQQFPQGWRFN